MISLVALSDSYVELTVEALRQHLAQLYPGHFATGAQDSFVIEGAVPGAQFMIKSMAPGASGIFLLHHVPGPYTDVSDFANYIEDSALLRRAQAQSCWLSVDRLGVMGTERDAYPFIANVLAHLAPAETAALVHPATQTTIAFDNEVRRQLASGGEIFGLG
jgi:hypothetical protein